MRNAFVLAAGLGTRLKPWTDFHPKALAEVHGRPVLEWVIEKLVAQGFGRIVVNVHHFASQIIDFLSTRDFGIPIIISDESGGLLDTGGGVLKASALFAPGEPVLVHNADILSDADLQALFEIHVNRGNGVTMLTSGRDSSRKLAFDCSGSLRGWVNVGNGETKPRGFIPSPELSLRAFSGIYVMSSKAFDGLRAFSAQTGTKTFPIMDYFLDSIGKDCIKECFSPDLKLVDIGKPQTLKEANTDYGEPFSADGISGFAGLY